MSWAVKAFVLSLRLPLTRDWICSPPGLRWTMRFGVANRRGLSAETIAAVQSPFAGADERAVLRKTGAGPGIKGFFVLSERLKQFTGPFTGSAIAFCRILPIRPSGCEAIYRRRRLPGCRTAATSCRRIVRRKWAGCRVTSLDEAPASEEIVFTACVKNDRFRRSRDPRGASDRCGRRPGSAAADDRSLRARFRSFRARARPESGGPFRRG